MTRFEDKLEAELEALVAENAPPARPRTGFGWKPRLAVVAAVAAAATAVATSGILQRDNPAWAIEKTADGTVRIEFNEFEDPEGLEKELAKLGLRADVVFVPHGKMRDCEPSPHDQVDPAGPVTANGGETDALELRYGQQRPDQLVVIELWVGPEEGLASVRYQNILGPPARCDLVDADTMFPLDRKHQSGSNSK